MNNSKVDIAVDVYETIVELYKLDNKLPERLKDLLLLKQNAPMQYEMAAMSLRSKTAKYKK